MSFFDSKEENIKIELTPYGKYLLSQGKFIPKFYCFFDDDILYDSKYANFTESQNYSQQRILLETPFCKPQSNFSSAEERSKTQYQVVISEEGDRGNIINFSTFLPYSIGSCDTNTMYVPSWNIKCLTNNIDTQTDTPNKFEYSLTPQINLKDANMFLKHTKSLDDLKNEEDVFAVFEGGNYIISSQQDLSSVFSVMENNVVDKKENFIIEVFMEINDNEYRQLDFFKKPTNVEDNILLDEYLYSKNPGETPDEYNVEHYFDLLVDEEIINSRIDRNITSQIYSTPIKVLGDC